MRPKRRSNAFTNRKDCGSDLLEFNQGVELSKTDPIFSWPDTIPVSSNLCDGVPVWLREEPEKRVAAARDFNADPRPVPLECALAEGLAHDRLKISVPEPVLDHDTNLREDLTPTTIGDHLVETGWAS